MKKATFFEPFKKKYDRIIKKLSVGRTKNKGR